jgi:quinoprotein dehydrogenase-associated probable ABC transporter substrate-binding protein
MKSRLGLILALAALSGGCASDGEPTATEVQNQAAAAAPTASAANSADDGKFKVCADPVNPPYSTREQTGYENEIAQLFARQLGRELQYTWLPDRIGFIRNTLKAENPDGKGFKCDVVMGVPAGYDLVATTIPYLHSTYVMLIAKGRGWDDIHAPEQVAQLAAKRKKKLKIAMFDRSQGTAWLGQNNLLEQGVPYQSMTGDSEQNIAMQLAKDLGKGKIDMAIVWGPMAAYVQSQAPGKYTALNMVSSKEVRFDFAIAMGVRQADKARKQQLNQLIEANLPQIQAILSKYGIPQLALEAPKAKKD